MTEYGQLFDGGGVGMGPDAFVGEIDRFRAQIAEQNRALDEAQVRYDVARARLR